MFSGWNLQPAEKTSRTLILPIPEVRFDSVTVHAAFPIIWSDGKLVTQWKVTPKGLILERFKPGELAIPIDESDSQVTHEIRKSLGYGVVSDFAAVSLWPRKVEDKIVRQPEPLAP